MPDKPWKRQEREVARALGGRRNPNTGRPQADIDAGPFAVEHKALRRLPQWLLGALEQAKAAADGRTPIVVLSEVSQGRKARRLVLLGLEDFATLTSPQEAPGCRRYDGKVALEGER